MKIEAEMSDGRHYAVDSADPKGRADVRMATEALLYMICPGLGLEQVDDSRRRLARLAKERRA